MKIIFTHIFKKLFVSYLAISMIGAQISVFSQNTYYLSTPGTADINRSIKYALNPSKDEAVPVILAFNAGSTSVKCKVYEENNLNNLIFEKNLSIGKVDSDYKTYEEAVKHIFNQLSHWKFPLDIKGMGHRVVHGGKEFKDSTLIDDRVISIIKEHFDIAPIHNPPNLEVILICKKLFPHVPQTAVFDTAFHADIPSKARAYALDYRFFENHDIMSYGFHGISHRYVARKAAEQLGKPIDKVNLITCHLGGGSSVCAIKNGKSIDTSMGFTPLEGLVMMTRSGDVDPGLLIYILERFKFVDGKLIFAKEPLPENERMTAEELDILLNKKSGLKGLSGIPSDDLRKIKEAAEKGDARATLAIEVFIYRLQDYIGKYFARLGTVNAIVFTGGIGENAEWLRERVINELPLTKKMSRPMKGNRKTHEFAIKTDEEYEIASAAKTIKDIELQTEILPVTLPEIDGWTKSDMEVILAAPKASWTSDVELSQIDVCAVKTAYSAIEAAREYYESHGKKPKIAFLSYHSTSNKDSLPEDINDFNSVSLAQLFQKFFDKKLHNMAKKRNMEPPKISKLVLNDHNLNAEYEKSYVLIIEKAFRLVELIIESKSLPFEITLVGKGGLQLDSSLLKAIFEKKTSLTVTDETFPPNVLVFPNLHSLDICKDLLKKEAKEIKEESAFDILMRSIKQQFSKREVDTLPSIVFPETIDSNGNFNEQIINAGIKIAAKRIAKVIFISHQPNLLFEKFVLIEDNFVEGLVEIKHPNNILAPPLKKSQHTIGFSKMILKIYRKAISLIKNKRTVNNEPAAQLDKNFGAAIRHLKRLSNKGIQCGMIAGEQFSTGRVVQAAAKFPVKNPDGSVKNLYDYFLMSFPDTSIGDEGLALFVNTALQECPDANDIVEMVLAAEKGFRDITDKYPRVALITSHAGDIKKMNGAWNKLDDHLKMLTISEQTRKKFIGKGPMTMAEALNDNRNVFIFPDLMSGNIAYKWSERVLHAKALGPFILGTRIPISDLSRGADIDSIIATATVLARLTSQMRTETKPAIVKKAPTKNKSIAKSQ